MNTKDWKNLVKNIAPVLGTALGGPLAGTATKYLADSLLGNPDATEDEIAKALTTASPETLAKLKELDLKFKTEMKQLDIDVFKLEVSDKASARDMAKENMWPQIILSAVFILGYFVILASLMYLEVSIQADIKEVVILLIGLITREVPTIMQFWFGSSHGSKNKTWYDSIKDKVLR